MSVHFLMKLNFGWTRFPLFLACACCQTFHFEVSLIPPIPHIEMSLGRPGGPLLSTSGLRRVAQMSWVIRYRTNVHWRVHKTPGWVSGGDTSHETAAGSILLSACPVVLRVPPTSQVMTKRFHTTILLLLVSLYSSLKLSGCFSLSVFDLVLSSAKSPALHVVPLAVSTSAASLFSPGNVR